MEPFLKNGQTVLASSIPFLFSKLKSGDIVVFKYKNKVFIKRIAKVKPTFTKVSVGKYFLEGDNRKDSLDSKKIGWIDRKDIIGKVVYKIYELRFKNA